MTARPIPPSLAALLAGRPGEPFTHPTTECQVILDQASAEGLTFLLRGLSGVPASVGERVDQECLNITARNLALAGELRSLLRVFRDQALRCVPLRGLALAERLYGYIPPRPMGDIDLLVQKEDLPRVQTLLRSLGFSEMDRRSGFALAFSYTLKFFVERSVMIVVEPHWTIAYPPFADRLNMEAVWNRCVPARVLGEETLSLGSEDLLVHLCLHLAHRDDAPLLWLYELDRYLRQEAIRWDLIVSVSREVGIERMVGRALNKAVTGLGSPVPADVLESLCRPGFSPPLAQRLVECSDVDGVESLAYFFALKGLGARFRYARALLLPQPNFMMLQYGLTHRRQLAATYVRRFCWFSWQAIRGLVHLCRGGARSSWARLHRAPSSDGGPQSREASTERARQASRQL